MPDDSAATILATHPSLNTPQTDNTSADAYAPPELPKGLMRDANQDIIIRPEIDTHLDETKRERVYQLITLGRISEANTYLGCCLIHIVNRHCPHWCEAWTTITHCGKLFLCDVCAEASTRLARFANDYPHLYEHLLASQLSVLTFTIEDQPWDKPSDLRDNLDRAQAKFREFMSAFTGDEHAWAFYAAFGHDSNDASYFPRTKFYAIHAGPRLPHWPTLNGQWRQIAGPHATLRVKLFDGKDGDLQSDGLKLALSGLEEFHDGAADMDGWPVADISAAFRGYDTSTPYGWFRGFDARINAEEAATAGPDPEPATKEKCGHCGEGIIRDPKPALMTINELHAKGTRIFSHNKSQTYRRNTKPEACTCIGHEHGDG